MLMDVFLNQIMGSPAGQLLQLIGKAIDKEDKKDMEGSYL